jgi:phospholipid/cholesterol/gamma-HCH transport system ATP-binding protein
LQTAAGTVRQSGRRSPLLPGAGAPVNSDALVEIERLTFGYDSRAILADVSLSFGRGQVVAIMGGSGMGKTTLLKLIGGMLRPGSGTIRIGGERVDPRRRDALFALRKRIGMLFQFGALFTDLSVFDNVAFPLRENTQLPETMIRDLVLMKLNAVGLRGAAALMPAEISGGMARRVALARAIALDPELILYDEPFAGLDPISLGVTANLIRRLNDALHATSLVVTHDVAETFLIADYVYVVSSGAVAAHGTPEQLGASDDPFVRQFIEGAPDGPVAFHYPAAPLAEDFGRLR